MNVHSKAPGRVWLTAAALILVLALLFTGCSHGTDQQTDPATTAGTDTPAAAPLPAETLQPGPTAEELAKTCWDASFGRSLNDFFALSFHSDGSFGHYRYSTKSVGDTGRYSYDGRLLNLEFQDGSETYKGVFRWDGNGFISTEEMDMGVGKGYYTLAQSADAEAFFAAPEVPDTSWSPYLNKTDISFFGAGESFTLVLLGVPVGTEVEWTTENEEIASVDPSGHVTAVGPGSARIYAQVGEEKLVCWIRCQFAAPAGEEAPSLNKTDISFFGIGESYRLSVENLPEDTKVVWSSEDVYVATVDENGRVTAEGPGTIRIAAQAGDTTLYCWVRCQFEGIAGPHSSIGDGEHLVTLYKDGLTPVGTAPDRYLAEAAWLDHVWVEQTELDRLQNGSALDLTAFGMQVCRVSAARYDTEDEAYYVEIEGGMEMVFRKDDADRWCPVSENGEFLNFARGGVRLAFTENTVLLDQMSAVLNGESEPIKVDHLPELFGRQPGFENELPMVGVTVENGVVTQAIWYYQP